MFPNASPNLSLIVRVAKQRSNYYQRKFYQRMNMRMESNNIKKSQRWLTSRETSLFSKVNQNLFLGTLKYIDTLMNDTDDTDRTYT